MFGSEPRQTLPQAPSYLSSYITAARRNSASAETVSGIGLPCFPPSLAWSVRSLCLLSESGCRLRSDCDMKDHFAAREQCTCGSVFPFLAPDYRLAVTGWVRICIKPKPDSSLRWVNILDFLGKKKKKKINHMLLRIDIQALFILGTVCYVMLVCFTVSTTD